MSKIGVSKFFYAKQTTEDSATADGVYATAVAIPGLVSVDVTKDDSVSTLYADNGPFEVANNSGAINVTIDLADLPLSAQADLLGHTYDSTNGTLTAKNSDVVPYVGIMFEIKMGNGKKLCVKLFKGKFAEAPVSAQTQGENVEFGTNQITASFVALKGLAGNTGKWKYVKEYDANASTDDFYTGTFVPADAGQ